MIGKGATIVNLGGVPKSTEFEFLFVIHCRHSEPPALWNAVLHLV